MKNTTMFHPYHLVDIRPWPLTSSLRALILTAGIAKWFNHYNPDLFFLGIAGIILSIIQWWRDITREGRFQGLHTKKVTHGLQWGIILFITSEVLFFFSFFWAFFHRRLSPCLETGRVWPPLGIDPLNPFQVPLLNTIILLASGVTVTWAHHSLLHNKLNQALESLLFTVILGAYFTRIQAIEYREAPFSIADSIYGSTFFVATGFHGLHVIIGATFLLVCWMRLKFSHFSSSHHFGFEAAAWYWHFVDVVWLFLYTFIYWWGRYLFSIISTRNFQFQGPLGINNNNINNYRYSYFYSKSNFNRSILFNCRKNLLRPRKNLPVWMWIWAYILKPNSIFFTILYGSSNFSSIWCRNCVAITSILFVGIKIIFFLIFHLLEIFSNSYSRHFIWMNIWSFILKIIICKIIV